MNDIEDWGFEPGDISLTTIREARRAGDRVQWHGQCCCHKKISIKTPNTKAQGHVLVGTQTDVTGGGSRLTCPNSTGRVHRSSAFAALPNLSLCVSSFDLFWFVSSRIKLIANVVLSWVLSVILVNHQTWGGHGKTWICRQLVRGWMAWGPLYWTCGWHLKSGQSWGLPLKPLESVSPLGGKLSESHCGTAVFNMPNTVSGSQEMIDGNY